MKNIIGILGGMGPAATVDIFNKFVNSKVATKDQDHIPLLISSIPDIPDRTAALLEGGESPLEKMKEYMKKLEVAGAKCIVIPCNTAHFWFDELQKSSCVEMISIIECAINELKARGEVNVGILATKGTLETKLYQNALIKNGFNLFLPESEDDVMKSIYSLKAGDLDGARALMEYQAKALFDKGAKIIVLGCTETPIILENAIKKDQKLFLDATQELVNCAIRWYEKA